MYSTVREMAGAIEAAAAIAAAQSAVEAAAGYSGLEAQLPLLIDQVGAEAGVVAPSVCARALQQARGDVARAVSLVRAWAAILPRLENVCADAAEMQVLRRITPAFRAPEGGQFLGASLDYANRLLDLGGTPPISSQSDAPAVLTNNGDQDTPASFPRAGESLEQEGILARTDNPAAAFDRTRTNAADVAGRGAFLQLLARGETGALTSLAYSAQRGFGQRQDPTLLELRQGSLPVRMSRPDGGGTFTVAWLPVTTAEVAMYRIHDGRADARLTLGFGATTGKVERRAIAAAILDATCARAEQQPPAVREPSEDREFLSAILDGQEASGFVEHLKLPHHVTFTSDLDRVRQVQGQ